MSENKKLYEHAPDPQSDGARVDLADEMTYGRHLMLDQLLSAQQPLSTDHNEWLFIIQHQTTELWMKLALIELRAACAAIAADQLPIAFKTLARVARILEHLVHAWGVLVTMTPSEFSAIRPYLGSGSGFQSWQYREIEFVLGNKNAATLKAHAHRADLHTQLEAALAAPSLYDQAIGLLGRRGLPIAASVLTRRSFLKDSRRMPGSTKEKHDAQIAIAPIESNARDLSPIARAPRSGASACSRNRERYGHHQCASRRRYRESSP